MTIPAAKSAIATMTSRSVNPPSRRRRVSCSRLRRPRQRIHRHAQRPAVLRRHGDLRLLAAAVGEETDGRFPALTGVPPEEGPRGGPVREDLRTASLSRPNSPREVEDGGAFPRASDGKRARPGEGRPHVGGRGPQPRRGDRSGEGGRGQRREPERINSTTISSTSVNHLRGASERDLVEPEDGEEHREDDESHEQAHRRGSPPARGG